jgi:hypothetical protein
MATTKLFSNTDSRAQLDRAEDEARKIRRRIDRLDAALVAALDVRLQELDRALMHTRETLRALLAARQMRGRQ